MMFKLLRLAVLAAGLLAPTLCSHGGGSGHAPPPASPSQPTEKEDPHEHQAR